MDEYAVKVTKLFYYHLSLI
uniref:Uncharacterized protein n=1 Tax=Heterorhabditis bacteriophora TaxID=37862 RepID=A0A1I7WGD1_HETBA